mgnify:CR=1 FL=1
MYPAQTSHLPPSEPEYEIQNGEKVMGGGGVMGH